MKIMDETNVKKYFEQVKNSISYDDFITKIINKKEILGNLCDEDMCIQLVINDLDSKKENYTNNENKNNNQKKLKTIQEIKNIDNSEYVSFIGKVISISEIKEFNRKDNTIGKVQNMYIMDNTGKIKISIWDNKIENIKNENIVVNSSVCISGLAKKINSQVNININYNGFIGLNDKEVEIIMHNKKINDIKEHDYNISIKAVIIDILNVKTFIKKNGTEGYLKQFIIGDETGKLKLNLWDRQIEQNNNLKIGDSIVLEHINIKKNKYFNNLEISIEGNYKIKKLDYDIIYKQYDLKIDQINSIMNEINLFGKIIEISDIKTFIKKNGDSGSVGHILIGDETGKIQVTLWNENTSYLDEYNYDDVIYIKNCSSKLNNYTNQYELYLSSKSIIEKSNINIDFVDKITLLKDVKFGHIYNVSGNIKEIISNNNLEYSEYFINEKDIVMILDDDTKKLKVIVSNKQDKFLNFNIEENITIYNVFSKYDKDKNIILYTNSKSIIQ